jgi:hypothetical protein
VSTRQKMTSVARTVLLNVVWMSAISGSV